jgi:hypothetical protein
VIGAVATAALLAATVPAGPAPTDTLFHLADGRLSEVSGIARGIASPDVYYVQNDSGDPARFFALDARTGAVRAVYRVPGARNHDWEDLAVAPDAAGVPSVWLADIGDNGADRSEVELYRVDEPKVDPSARNESMRTAPPQVWRLRYPAGPVDAESVAVTPRGRAFIVTKSDDGGSVVYAVPPQPDPRSPQLLRRVAGVTFRPHGGLIPASLQVRATGAAFSSDGALFAVRTYTDAYVWRVGAGGLTSALGRAPRRIQLPLQPQGEGICFDGGGLVIDSERVGSAVFRVSPDTGSGAGPAPATSGGATSISPTAPSPSSTAPAGPDRTALSVPVRIVLAAGSAALGLLLLARAVRRRRHRE